MSVTILTDNSPGLPYNHIKNVAAVLELDPVS